MRSTVLRLSAMVLGETRYARQGTWFSKPLPRRRAIGDSRCRPTGVFNAQKQSFIHGIIGAVQPGCDALYLQRVLSVSSVQEYIDSDLLDPDERMTGQAISMFRLGTLSSVFPAVVFVSRAT